MTSPPPPPRKGKINRRIHYSSDNDDNSDPFGTPQKRPRPRTSDFSPKQFMPSVAMNAMMISPQKHTKSPNKSNSAQFTTPVKKLIGYKVLGYGSKGCVVWPSFSNPDDKTLVGKLMADKKDAEHEYEISNMLAKLDPNEEYLIYPKNMTTPAFQIEANQLLRTKCYKFMDDIEDGKKFYELTMKYGTDFNIYELSVQDFMKAIKNIIHGVNVLQKAHYIHQDLEPKNIIHIDGTYKIIDFSECKKAADVYKQTNQEKLENMSPIIPPEAMVYIDHIGESEIQNYLHNMKFYKTKDSVDRNKISCKELWMKLHGYKTELDVHKAISELSKRKITPDMWKSYALKMDVFAIGMIILSYIRQTELLLISSPSKNKNIEPLQELGMHMTMLDPTKRIDISRCVQILA